VHHFDQAGTPFRYELVSDDLYIKWHAGSEIIYNPNLMSGTH
jgi:hypothetical protein